MNAHLLLEGLGQGGALVDAEESGHLVDVPAGRVEAVVAAALLEGRHGRGLAGGVDQTRYYLKFEGCILHPKMRARDQQKATTHFVRISFRVAGSSVLLFPGGGNRR